MNTQEKLEKIKAKCSEIIALKMPCKTPAFVMPGGYVGSHQIAGVHYKSGWHHGASDYAASSAGPAEAMARSTLLALEIVSTMAGGAVCTHMENEICNAWPDELL